MTWIAKLSDSDLDTVRRVSSKVLKFVKMDSVVHPGRWSVLLWTGHEDLIECEGVRTGNPPSASSKEDAQIEWLLGPDPQTCDGPMKAMIKAIGPAKGLFVIWNVTEPEALSGQLEYWSGILMLDMILDRDGLPRWRLYVEGNDVLFTGR